MSIKLLKRLIRETVEYTSEIDNSDIVEGIPTTFNSFRKLVSSSLKECGASNQVTHQLDEIDFVAGGSVQSLHEAWNDIDIEMRGTSGKRRREQWEFCVDYYVKDSVEYIARLVNEVNAKELANKVAKRIVKS